MSSCSHYYRPVVRTFEPDPTIVQKVEELAFRRPFYGTRRMAAQLSRELQVPLNRKRVQKVFHKLNWIEPAKTKTRDQVRLEGREGVQAVPILADRNDLSLLRQRRQMVLPPQRHRRFPQRVAGIRLRDVSSEGARDNVGQQRSRLSRRCNAKRADAQVR